MYTLHSWEIWIMLKNNLIYSANRFILDWHSRINICWWNFVNQSIRLNDKKKTDIRQEVLNTGKKNYEGKCLCTFSSFVCNDVFLWGLLKCPQKKLNFTDLWRSTLIILLHFSFLLKYQQARFRRYSLLKYWFNNGKMC